MRILITDEMSLSTAFTSFDRSFLYSFSFVPTVITARQLAAVTPASHSLTIQEGNSDDRFQRGLRCDAYQFQDCSCSKGVRDC